MPPVRKLPIAVCMIVRDEARNLPEALASVAPFASELIVVDTGSADQTVAIAESFGARVLRFTWCDDFSAARNVYLDAVSADWVLSLDADQRVDPRSIPALADAIKRQVLGQIVRISLVDDTPARPELGSYTALRLFRRHPRIRYSGRVHEDVSPSIAALGARDWPDARVSLIDIGYADPAERQRKRERNLALLERAVAEAPHDHFLAWKLAQTLPPEQAPACRALLAQTATAVRAMTPQARAELPFLPPLIAAHVAALTAEGDLVAATEAATALAEALGGTARFTAGVALARAGRLAEARDQLTRYRAEATRLGPNVATHPDPDASPAAAALWLAEVLRQAGDPTGAEATIQAGLRGASPTLQLALGCERVRLHLAARRLPEAAAALDALGRAVPKGAALQPLMLVSAEVALASRDLAGARALADAALDPRDDRAAALLATLDLAGRATPPERLAAHLARVPGLRHETLAVRAALAARLGKDPGVPLPAASQARAEALSGRR
jgi:hypothetical protein